LYVRRLVLALASVVASLGLVAGPATAGAGPAQPVSVGGQVADPASYTVAQLAALPQTTVQVRTLPWAPARTEQGVLLETLVNDSSPNLPDAKNAPLRVAVTVIGLGGRSVTFALGELDPSFGNHPAVVAIRQDGVLLPSPELVVPGDSLPLRDLATVARIDVAVENPTPTTPPAGAVDLADRRRTVLLTPALLDRLPARTLSVTSLAGTTSETLTEQGPPLVEVLAAAGVAITPDTWVAAVGDDGYVALVTPDEALVGGRPLLLSLAEDGAALPEPRLVVDGDVKGGRHVSGWSTSSSARWRSRLRVAEGLERPYYSPLGILRIVGGASWR
jgi:hypothetical protein